MVASLAQQKDTAMNNSSSFNVTPSLASAACVCDYAMNSYIFVNNLAAAVVCAPVAAFTAISNAVVIVTVIRTASLQTPANILLCSLACGDFLVAVLPQPILVAILLSSNAGMDCCLFGKLFMTHMYSTSVAFGSLVQVCVMCWDRLKATSDPLIYRSVVSKRKITVATVAAWVGWLCFSIGTVFLPLNAKAVVCSLKVIAVFSFLVVSQVLTSRAMRAHNTSIAGAIPQATAMAREKKMAVTVRWIIGASFVSGIPAIMYFVSVVVLGRDSLFCSLLSPWVKITLFSISAVNPIIYFWRHNNMRSAALEVVRPCMCSVAPPE